MSLHTVLLFCWISLFSYIIPGPDWVYVSSNALRTRRLGIVAALGVQTGLLFHLFVTAMGATVIFITYPPAFVALQALGALYLIYLGASAIYGLKLEEIVIDEEAIVDSALATQVYFKGILVDILNPKVALFFISILPQFIEVNVGANTGNYSEVQQLFVLASLDISLGIAWWLILCFALDKINKTMNNPKLKYYLELVAGLSLLLFGLAMIVKLIAF